MNSNGNGNGHGQPMSATARASLEFLGDRYKQSFEAAKIADGIKRSRPKAQAALGELRDLGLVHHFPEKGGHAGLWAVTPAGYQQVDASKITPDRLRMALEIIGDLEPYLTGQAPGIARKALKP